MFVQELINVVFTSSAHDVTKRHVQKVTTTVNTGLNASELGGGGHLLPQCSAVYNYAQFEHLSVIFGSSACLFIYITFQQCLEHQTFELSARTDSSVQMTCAITGRRWNIKLYKWHMHTKCTASHCINHMHIYVTIFQLFPRPLTINIML